MDFLKKPSELLIRKPASKESQIDYMTYDTQRHILCVGMNRQKLSYLGVPDSVFFHLSLIDYPDDFFFGQIFNKYPVVIEREKTTTAVAKRRKRFLKQLTQESAPLPEPDDDEYD